MGCTNTKVLPPDSSFSGLTDAEAAGAAKLDWLLGVTPLKWLERDKENRFARRPKSTLLVDPHRGMSRVI